MDKYVMTFYEWLIGSDFVEHLDNDWPVEARSTFECVAHLKDIHAPVSVYRDLIREWQAYEEEVK